PYEAPSDGVLVSEEDLKAKWGRIGKRPGGNGLAQTLTFLKARGLLPLRYSSPALPYLCKLLGFVFGDAALYFEKDTGKGVVLFPGAPADPQAIRAAPQAVGVPPPKVYSRTRQHVIQTAYAEYEFEREEEWFKVVGSGFALLLACLGAPIGKKTHQDYTVPQWLHTAPLWQKRLFLASFFGAELSTPATITDHGTVFGQPTLGMNKRPQYLASGREFLRQISAWLEPFGVVTYAILSDAAQENTDGERSVRLRLVLSPKADSLANLWSRVGYEYNGER